MLDDKEACHDWKGVDDSQPNGQDSKPSPQPDARFPDVLFTTVAGSNHWLARGKLSGCFGRAAHREMMSRVDATQK